MVLFSARTGCPSIQSRMDNIIQGPDTKIVSAQIRPTSVNPHVPDVDRIWTEIMLLPGEKLV